jgi:hypothetical protein
LQVVKNALLPPHEFSRIPPWSLKSNELHGIEQEISHRFISISFQFHFNNGEARKTPLPAGVVLLCQETPLMLWHGKCLKFTGSSSAAVMLKCGRKGRRERG